MSEPIDHIIPDVAAFLGQGQNLIIAGLIAIGYIVRHLPVKNSYIPSIITISSVVLTPFFIKPFVVAFVLSFVYACLAMLTYEALIRHVEDWIKRKLGISKEDPTVKDSLTVQPRPFKDQPPTDSP